MNRNQRRVVITGIGVVSALGNTPDTLFANLLAGKSAVRMMADWPHPALAAPLAELPDAADIPRSMRRTMGNVALYCAAAGKAAAQHAGITEFPDGRTLCAAGSTMGSSLVFEETFNTLLLGKGMADVSPMNFFKCASHTAAYNMANVLGIDAVTYSPAAACASGLQAVGLASTLIAAGEADVAVAGGSEELSHMVSESFVLMDAHASVLAGEAVQEQPRPFDSARRGLVCGEGAAVFVLEEYEYAKRRGADILAEISGYATNRGRENVTQSDSGSVIKCFELLRGKCDIPPLEQGFINAHATGTLQGDRSEAEAVRRFFGGNIPVSSLKGNIGHTLGAAGAIELAVSVEMLRRNIILPTANLCSPAAECSGIDHVSAAREKKCSFFIKNSFAFGGINAVMMCRKI